MSETIKTLKKFYKMGLIEMEAIQTVILEGEINHIEINNKGKSEYYIWINHELCGWRYSMVDAIELQNMLIEYILPRL